MLRLYMDEDSMDRALIRALRARGFDSLTADEAGMIERSDEDHLRYAVSERRVQRYSVGEQLRRLVHLAGAISSDAMTNRAEFVSAWPPLA